MLIKSLSEIDLAHLAFECLQVLSLWLRDFKIDKVGMEDTMKVRFLLRPMVQWLVQHGQTEALSSDVIQSLVQNVFGTVSAEGSDCNELFQAEIIQLCVTLVEHVPNLLADYKKQIIQYIWYEF